MGYTIGYDEYSIDTIEQTLYYYFQDVFGTSAHELVHTALRRWAARNMRADNSSAIVVYIEKKKMEPKNGGTSAYTERWTSANKSEHSKVYEDPKPVVEEPIKPEGEVRQPLTDLKPRPEIIPGNSVLPASRKRLSKENNNLTPIKRSKSTPNNGASSKAISRRRSTRIAVKRCEHGLTRSAARKRASL
jgi:hypothetical protein